MIEHPERVEQFKRDIAEMQVRDPAAGRDRLALRGGIALMIVGHHRHDRGVRAVAQHREPARAERRDRSSPSSASR